MNKKLFVSLTAVTVASVGGYLVYRHVVPRALDLFLAEAQKRAPVLTFPDVSEEDLARIEQALKEG